MVCSLCEEFKSRPVQSDCLLELMRLLSAHHSELIEKIGTLEARPEVSSIPTHDENAIKQESTDNISLSGTTSPPLFSQGSDSLDEFVIPSPSSSWANKQQKQALSSKPSPVKPVEPAGEWHKKPSPFSFRSIAEDSKSPTKRKQPSSDPASSMLGKSRTIDSFFTRPSRPIILDDDDEDCGSAFDQDTTYCPEFELSRSRLRDESKEQEADNGQSRPLDQLCSPCKKYYTANPREWSPREWEEKLEDCVKHKLTRNGFHHTPPGFWDCRFSDTPDQMKTQGVYKSKP